MSTDPTIIQLQPDEVPDPHWLEESLRRGEEQASRIPVHYRDAVVDVPKVAEWVTGLVKLAVEARATVPYVRTGPSLLLLGPTGTGKTFQAYGAIRALSVSGVGCPWLFTTAADMYAQIRPRPGSDPEAVFNKYAKVGVLVLDDLGAAKGSEWNEEINYRLINHRYEHELPTLITSNVAAKQLAAALGDRVASRLSEMTTRVALAGSDRRRAPKEVA